MTTNNYTISTLNNFSNVYNTNSKYAVVDSRCRAEFSQPTDNFSYQFNETLIINKYCKIVYASVPNTFYLINTTVHIRI